METESVLETKFVLESLKPCSEGLAWAKSKESYEVAWNECKRADWMLWLARQRNVDVRKLVKAHLACFKAVSHLMEDTRSIRAIELAGKFVEGYDVKELGSVAEDACDAANAAHEVYQYADAVHRIPRAIAFKVASTAEFIASRAAGIMYRDDENIAIGISVAIAYTGISSVDDITSHMELRLIELERCAHLVRTCIDFDDLNIG
jgi:hypothetical protein